MGWVLEQVVRIEREDRNLENAVGQRELRIELVGLDRAWGGKVTSGG